MLPPIIHAPPPKLGKVETRKRRGAVGSFDETDQVSEATATDPAGFAAPVAVTLSKAQTAGRNARRYGLTRVHWRRCCGPRN
jgi:hypothetical protein